MIAPNWLLFAFAALCGFFGGMAWVLGGIDHARQTRRDLELMDEKLRLNSLYGVCGSGPIDRINTMSFYPAHNKPINKPEPEMNTARHQFNTIQEARAFFKKARANRQTRHGYYQCADMLRARLNQHSRFVIGTEFMQ